MSEKSLTPFEAARILFQNNEKKDAYKILESLWAHSEKLPNQEFQIFGALVEISCLENKNPVMELLDSVLSGEGGFRGFLERRSLSEQSILLDWQGQIAYSLKDYVAAKDSLSRSASLGRDTSLIWRILGEVYIDQGDLDIAIRYVKRSLQIFRQLDLNIVSGREFPLGFFLGKNPLGLENRLDNYLDLLLRVTKVAKSQRNLKGVREIVLEMMHQFPDDQRLPKIRNLLENNWVEQSMTYAQNKTVNRLALQKPDTSTMAMKPRINPMRNSF
jgi:tetratricopeptide (TPR) repeat protein